MQVKKDWSLWLAIALPFAMILFVAASIYLPRLWAPKPIFDFVYAVNDTSKGYVVPTYGVRVVDGKITKEETFIPQDEALPANKQQRYTEPHLYRYDIATGESRSLTFEEAENLKLDDGKKSPDGFEVSQGGGYDGPFGGGSGPAIYLVGHSVSRKLDLRGVDSVYDFEFVGWVVR